LLMADNATIVVERDEKRVLIVGELVELKVKFRISKEEFYVICKRLFVRDGH
jgi:hypothetical protein